MGILRWLHRWLGIALGLFIAVVGLTGSWLIYDRELAAPAYALDAASDVQPLQQLYEQALKYLPAETDVAVRFPQKLGLPYQIWAGENQVVIDQYSGNVLAVRKAEFWPYGWMFHLHKELLLGKRGETLSGWQGVLLFLIVLAGVALWWPRKWKAAFQLRFRQSGLIFWRDLHKQVGIVATPFLLLAIVTGVSLNFSEWVSQTASTVFGSGETAALAINPQASVQKPRPLDEIASQANAALAGGRIGIISIPASPTKPIVVRKQMPGDPHPNGLNFVYLDRNTAEVLQVIPLQEAEPARRWFNWAYPLHTGQALQPWHHWALLVVGLLPALFFVTGIYMYVLRKRNLRRVRQAGKA